MTPVSWILKVIAETHKFYCSVSLIPENRIYIFKWGISQ